MNTSSNSSRGLYTEEGRMSAKEVERLSPRRIRVVLVTGHKRQIRLMFQTLGYTVQRLIRIRIGSFVLNDIPPGKWRYLEAREVESLLVNPSIRKPTDQGTAQERDRLSDWKTPRQNRAQNHKEGPQAGSRSQIQRSPRKILPGWSQLHFPHREKTRSGTQVLSRRRHIRPISFAPVIHNPSFRKPHNP